MDIKNYYMSEKEKPLDKIADDGGFCAIFRSIGDSLSSGEFQTKDAEGNNFNDFTTAGLIGTEIDIGI